MFNRLTVPSDSSVAPGFEASRLTALSGRLQTRGSSFVSRPPNACSHRIPAAKSRAESEKQTTLSSGKRDLMSQLTSEVSDGDEPPLTLALTVT